MSSHSAKPALVGRDPELARLSGLLHGVRDGGGSLVVRGEPGIGKSALLAEAADAGRAAGLRVLSTAGTQAEFHLPYAGLHRLLHPARLDDTMLPDPQRRALAAALGLIDAPVPDLYLVGLATLNLLVEAASRTPLLVLTDDGQWLDPPTAGVLSFVARRLAAEPVALLVTLRDGVPCALAEAGLPELVLGPLPDAVAALLLDARAPGIDPRTRRRLLDEGAGNPLALVELTGEWRDQGAGLLSSPWLPLTERLERTFGARVGDLPAATRALLLVAALGEGTTQDEALAAAAVLAAGPVTRHDLAPGIRAGLIEPDAAHIRFRHPLMRSAIYQAASLPQRRAGHAALAAAPVRQGDEHAADRRIWHRASAAARPDEAIAAELDAMAARVAQRGAPTEAVTALEQAAKLTEDARRRADRLLRAADQAVELGGRDVVVRLLRQTELLPLTARQQAQSSWIRGTLNDGSDGRATGPQTLAALAESVAADGRPEEALRILWSAALQCFWIEPGAEARHRIVTAAESLPVPAANPLLLAILAYAAPIDRGAVVVEGLRKLAAEPVIDPKAARLLGSAAVIVGAFEQVETFSAAALPGLRAQGRLYLLTRSLAQQAWSAVLRTNLNVAIPAAEEAARLALETDQPQMYGTAVSTQAMLAALRGEPGQARELAARAEAMSVAAGVRPVLATVQMARGLAALGEGRHDEAYGHLRRLHDPADPSYQLALRCYVAAAFADAAAGSGNTGPARAVLRELEEAARRTPAPALHVGLPLARALLADPADARARFTDALAADHARWPFARAYTQVAYGEWLLGRGDPGEARPLLRAARDTFDALGTAPWSDRARRGLRACGEVSADRVLTARDKLTPVELQIARLAADGLSDEEIGEQVYLSRRTVGAHLARLLPKLGIDSRADLPALRRERAD
ncbi:ATP-binding protein [Herbidospora yilanensis]|uniref:ATP-binding protein n=1 Tax=Herbidospora yilanensis TaxID=354426 RepID=UPI000785C66A|nr:LuxR family transcriptional regulator [Herbidospora yilanensis]